MKRMFNYFFKNYANFKGRASRKEYWLFYLAMALIPVVIYVLAAIGMGLGIEPEIVLSCTMIALALFSLIIFIPALAVLCRRLHDSGRSGSYYFFSLIPVIGGILLFVWLIQDGDPCENRYGPDPKGRGVPARASAAAQIPVQQPQVDYTTVLVDQPVRMNQPDYGQIRCICEKGIIAGACVSGKRIVIGRDRNTCQLVFPENAKGVSRRHCAVYLEGDQVMVVDLGSRYGTYLTNGQNIPANTPFKLKCGDRFFVASGDTMIRVERG